MKKISIFLILLFLPLSTFANYNDIDNNLINAYNKIYSKIYTENKSDKGLNFLYSLQKSLTIIADSNKINIKNTSILSNLEELNNEKIFSLEQEKQKELAEKIFSQNSLFSNFKYKIYDTENRFSLENGIWYSYIFKNYTYFPDELKIKDITTKILEYNNIDYNKTVIFGKGNRIYFVSDYEKVKLVSDNILYGVPDKVSLLKFIKKYKIEPNYNKDIDNTLEDIRKTTKEITLNSITNEEKIQKIYDYILNNISYYEGNDLDNPDIYSGIKTFENKIGVCEGYVKIFSLMLAFSEIDSTIFTGNIIDTTVFGEVQHAWIQIGDYYYDPTFDDPVGVSTNKTIDQYIYFKLPKDLFYTNRYNTGEEPERIYSLDLATRQKIIKTNLFNLYNKYKDENYNILAETKFKKDNNIDIFKNLEISDLIKIIGKAYITDLKTVTINGTTKYFKSIKYFEINNDDSSLKSFLIQTKYDVDDYKIFLLEKDGKTSYLISNNYTFY